MNRLREKGLLATFVSAAIMYILLGAAFIQNAKSAPLGQDEEIDFDSVGWYYTMWKDDASNAYVAITVSTSLAATLTMRAFDDCRTGNDIDFSCVEARRPTLFGYMSKFVRETGKEATNGNLAEVFFTYVKEAKMDESANMSVLLAIFCEHLIAYYEKES